MNRAIALVACWMLASGAVLGTNAALASADAVAIRAVGGAAEHLALTEIDSGHWSPITDPQQLTAAIVAGLGTEPGWNP
ncbi:hypothetical protein [Nocardia sp. NPDC049707]|uniref:hypothetical protein n=1 Tax=Nocardia sp. NPDC049707 TaxID=3154735 RepID=UPI0034333936